MDDEVAQTGHGMAPRNEGLLRRLVGTELNRVIFVMDYLQLGFQGDHDSPVLNCYVWPTHHSPDAHHQEADLGYADALRSLITQTVTTAGVRGAGLVLVFSGGSSLSLELKASDAGAEIAVLQGFTDQAWEVWRPGEPPFDERREE